MQGNNKVSICFQAENDNITLVGVAEILTDQESKSRCWQNWFINHYPGGETDPNYIIVKITTRRVSLWVDGEIAAFTSDELLAMQGVGERVVDVK